MRRNWRLLVAGLLVACTSVPNTPTPIAVPTNVPTLIAEPTVSPAPSGSATTSPSPTPGPSATPSTSPSPVVRRPPFAPYVQRVCLRRYPEHWSVARVWNEAALRAIRDQSPAPTIHARNLFHLSVAMWDAWAAFEPDADGHAFTEKLSVDGDLAAEREATIAFAAYFVLQERYLVSETGDDYAGDALGALCYQVTAGYPGRFSPITYGRRIAAAVLSSARTDGAHRPSDEIGYEAVNEPLEIWKSGTTMVDPNRWQPIGFKGGRQTDQSGRPVGGSSTSAQAFVGPMWGYVRPFGLAADANGLLIDPGPPPRLGDPATDDEYKAAAVEVLEFSSQIDPADGVKLDTGPGSLGSNPLGTNDGRGHDLNPFTGRSYEPNAALRADYQRAMAEYWADGPRSETPPGHWNVIANSVSDAAQLERRIGGVGDVVDAQEWDVKLYLAINGALHDAAVAAWGLKGHYDSARPISMIRYMAGRGQSSDRGLPSFDEQGLPLSDGLVEIITNESARPGERHAGLAGHVGEIAVRGWRGFPADPARQTSGVGWILGIDWVPYQRATFVTPAFAGYVSGHSTFSRAAAEVLAAFTGSDFFPGGVYEWRTSQGDLIHELGPTSDVALQWATYFDAADAAGLSRLYMGIHISADDLAGRRVGAECGLAAWTSALAHFDGSAGP